MVSGFSPSSLVLAVHLDLVRLLDPVSPFCLFSGDEARLLLERPSASDSSLESFVSWEPEERKTDLAKHSLDRLPGPDHRLNDRDKNNKCIMVFGSSH